ncbi:MAG TPA: fumarylacetoacetase [Burkholderiaceae bacterium]|nr:fumarylacetoacetase [Burkholderiaceae bacterium]
MRCSERQPFNLESTQAMTHETHRPDLKSWVLSANQAGSDFPIQNLPHGVFRRRGSGEAFRGGVAIGEMILDMPAACTAGAFHGAASDAAEMAAASTLNGLMAMGPAAWSALRLRLSQLLRTGAPEAQKLAACLVAQSEAEYAVPAQIGDYTDFFTSYHHMMNAGRIFQPDKAELPNFKWLPIAYHGRASSVEISGTNFRRPLGQSKPPSADQPMFGPTRRLDYEMELGFFVGPGNARGESIAIDDADDHIFGVCLLNDWSARDVQAWESMPLGPFLAKNFITSISPWIVTLEALRPYRCALPREAGDPPTLAHLQASSERAEGGLDIQLEVRLQTAASGGTQMPLSRSSARHGYWSMAQMLTHHAEGGCNLRPGDLMGTGTQSGPTAGEEGCLLELSAGGRTPVLLANGETRSFLEDGDTVILRGWCERAGYARIGFGECRGTVLPAKG